jgi:hypothetical protein
MKTMAADRRSAAMYDVLACSSEERAKSSETNAQWSAIYMRTKNTQQEANALRTVCLLFRNVSPRLKEYQCIILKKKSLFRTLPCFVLPVPDGLTIGTCMDLRNFTTLKKFCRDHNQIPKYKTRNLPSVRFIFHTT